MKNLVVQRDWAACLPLDSEEAATQFAIGEGYGYVATSFLDVICFSLSDAKVRGGFCLLLITAAVTTVLCEHGMCHVGSNPYWKCGLQQVSWRCTLGMHVPDPDAVITGLAFSLELDALVVGLSSGHLLLVQHGSDGCSGPDAPQVDAPHEPGLCVPYWVATSDKLAC
jgi:hypothetical protein